MSRSGPVFVIGAPYSGNTAVAWSLAQSAELHHVAGAGWLSNLCTSLASIEKVGRQVKGRGAQISSVGHLAQEDVRTDRFWRTFGQGVDCLLAPPGANGDPDLAERYRIPVRKRSERPKRWLSAEPDLHALVHGLRLLFPHAQFVHVVRRPETSITAMTTRSRANTQPLDRRTAARRWRDAVRNGLDAEKALGSAVHRVTYENLVLDPEGELRRCREFLEVPWDPSCLRPVCGTVTSLLVGTDPNLLHHLPETPELAALMEELAGRPETNALPPSEAERRLAECLLDRAGVGPKRPAAKPSVRAVKALVAGCVSKGSKILVVSRGEEALLDLPGIEAQHFPQVADGVYAGHHPGTSAEAIEQLEALQGSGAQYLVVPRSSFWWFDYYSELREYLMRRFRLIGYQPDAGVAFDLGSPPGPDLFAVRYSDSRAGDQKGRYAGVRGDNRRSTVARMFGQAVDHFLIASDSAPVTIPEGWPVREVAGWCLASHPAMPVREMLDLDGRFLGLIIGQAIPPSGEAPGWGPLTLRCRRPDGFDEIEQALFALAGRYVCLVSAGGEHRLYLDAGGTLGAVYSPQRRTVASTTSLLQAVRDGPAFPRPAPDSYPADRENQFWPAGLTHLSWAHRLMPNHYLSLDAWTVRRHWPDGPIAEVSEIGLADQLHEIYCGVRQTMGGFQRHFDLIVGLTAGRDSRTLLACARDFAGSLCAATYDYGTRTREAARDVMTAGRVAELAEVPHIVAPAPDAGLAEREEYLFRIGHAGHWGKDRDYRAALGHLKLGGVWVSGFYGEMGRGYYWRALEKGSLGPETLLEQMKLPRTESFVGAMQQWLAGLPDLDPRSLLDLLLLEVRGGCWAGPHLYGMAPFQAIAVPFASRRAISAMLRLPAEYRRLGRMCHDLTMLRWPELLEVPFGGPA